MKKTLSFILAFALMLMAVSGAVSANTVEPLEDGTVLYQAEEITDIDALLQRAQAGVDDLSANTDYKITIPEQSNLTRSAAVPAEESYVTSQLLRSEVVDGDVVDSYVAVVLRAVYNNSQSKTDGYLVSRLYFNYNSSKPNGAVQLTSSSATVNTSNAASLVMVNGAQKNFSSGRITTSKQYGYPSQGTYTLGAATSMWVEDTTGYLYLNSRLTMNNGTTYNVEFFLDTYGHFA